MEYTTRDYAEAPCTPDAPYLARIGHLASTAEESAERILEFIARCRGGVSAEARGGAAPTRPMTSGHFGQLDRLNEAMISLDKLSRELGTIG